MDHYYGQEEEVETPETQLDNFRAQTSAVQAVDVYAKETLVNIYDTTFAMWNLAGDLLAAAVARGDTQTAGHLTTIQNTISELYLTSEHMQETLLHSNVTNQTILEAAQALANQKNEIEAELEELVEAINTADYNHPQVQALIENVEADVYEMVSEGAYEEVHEEITNQVHDDVISDMYTVIRKSAPPYHLCYRRTFLPDAHGPLRHERHPAWITRQSRRDDLIGRPTR